MSPLTFRTTLSTVFILLFVATSPLFAGKAPAFELPTETGSVSLEKLQGKVVLLDFWASWCTPCKKSFPWMNQLQKKYEKEGLVIVAVNLDKERNKAQAFLKQTPGQFIIAYDPEAKSAEQFKVMGMPSSYIIDRKGELHASHIGFRESDTDSLESKIRSALTQ